MSPITLLFIENYFYWLSFGLTVVAYASFFVHDFYKGKNIPAASKLYGICETFYYLSQLFGNPFFGVFADHFGRKNTILVIIIAASVDWFIISTARTSIIIIISRFIHGFCDSYSPTVSSYMSDLTTQDNFAKKMGMLHGLGGIGLISGLLVAFLLSRFGLKNQHLFILSSVALFIDGMFVYLFLPESIETKNSKKFDWSRANPAGSFKFIFKNEKNKPLIAILILDIIGGTCCLVILQFYLRMKFHFTEGNIYLILFEASLFQIFSMAVLLKISIKKRGNKQTLIDAFVAQALMNFLSVVATRGWMFYLIVPLVYQFVAFSVIQSFFKNLVDKKNQGVLFGSLQFSANLANVLAKYMYPIVFSYSSTKYHFPEAVFIIALICSLLGLYIVTQLDEGKYFVKKKCKNSISTLI